MRKSFAVVLMMAVAVAAIPGRLFAAVRAGGGDTGTLNGVAQGADKQALSKYTVQIRNAKTGNLMGTTVSSEAGNFSFTGLAADNYVIEIVDATGKVVGLSPSVAVGAGATVSVTVSASAAGAIAAAAGGGFSLLGLGPLASIAVVGAAATTTAFVAVKASNDTASPSN